MFHNKHFLLMETSQVALKLEPTQQRQGHAAACLSPLTTGR